MQNPNILATLARHAATEVADLAVRILARDDYAHRPTHVQRALRMWDAACMAAVRADPKVVLPAWPLWRGVPRSPIELAVLIVRTEGDHEGVAALARGILGWAEAWEKQVATAAPGKAA